MPGIVGFVTAADQPVVGAMVQPAPGPGNPAPEREVFAQSAADGSYALGLLPGEWEITISADGYHPQVRRVVIPPKGTVELDISLAPAARP